jgi:hypothetical protein
VKALLAALATLLVLGVPAAGADAKQVSAARGDVKATLTYARNTGRYSFGYRTEKLTISRAGRTLYSGVPAIKFCGGSACSPTIGQGRRQPPLIVRDLDGDSEPEVVYTAYSGGAHCCIVAAFFELSGGGKGYTPVDRVFGNPGFRIEDLNHDGRPEVVTADDTFAYRFSPYAFSGLPLLVLRYDHGQFKGITARFKRRLRIDAKRFWHAYSGFRGHDEVAARGQIAAWAADQYRLGKRGRALAILRREVRHGHLSRPGSGAKFIRRVDRFLRKRGYGG